MYIVLPMDLHVDFSSRVDWPCSRPCFDPHRPFAGVELLPFCTINRLNPRNWNSDEFVRSWLRWTSFQSCDFLVREFLSED